MCRCTFNRIDVNSNEMDKIKVTRLSYVNDGKVVYEWEQTLDDLHVYIQPPPNVTAKMLECTIASTTMMIGLRDNLPFLNEKFNAYINASESMWYRYRLCILLMDQSYSADPLCHGM